MGWRWRKSIGLGGGARTTISPNGIGVSWGFAGFRLGKSPTGAVWISYTIPLTGISFFKYINQGTEKSESNMKPTTLTQAPAIAIPTPRAIAPLTANQRLLEKIKSSTAKELGPVLSSAGIPSEVTDQHWIQARRRTGSYPSHTENGGKWLLFAPLTQVDAVWDAIRRATEGGTLGEFSKVSTARPNSNANDPDTKVICVYTYDSDDKEDVMRVRQELRRLGFSSKISYKTDNDTRVGKYANRGGTKIAKYYE